LTVPSLSEIAVFVSPAKLILAGIRLDHRHFAARAGFFRQVGLVLGLGGGGGGGTFLGAERAIDAGRSPAHSWH
jgi:hypothetical protein